MAAPAVISGQVPLYVRDVATGNWYIAGGDEVLVGGADPDTINPDNKIELWYDESAVSMVTPSTWISFPAEPNVTASYKDCGHSWGIMFHVTQPQPDMKIFTVPADLQPPSDFRAVVTGGVNVDLPVDLWLRAQGGDCTLHGPNAITTVLGTFMYPKTWE
jgi:hypothetical protein